MALDTITLRKGDKLYNRFGEEMEKEARLVHLDGPVEFLDCAKVELIDRACTYDSPKGEKSMKSTVDAFNIIMGKALDENGGRLTEAMGWEFMSILKKVRQFSRTRPHRDSATDDVAYTALAAEARMNELH